MSDRIVLSKLTREYAILRGKFNDAERTVEPVVGLHAIREKWIEIESTKRLLKRKMDQIEGTIRQFDPTFEGERVKPLRPPPPTKRAPGSISRPALAALRKAGQPMTAWEVAKVVATSLGLEAPDSRELSRISNMVSTTFDKYVLKGQLTLAAENPKRWVPASASSRSAVSADVRPAAANSLSNPARSAA
jgi:hypothetical protein